MHQRYLKLALGLLTTGICLSADPAMAAKKKKKRKRQPSWQFETTYALLGNGVKGEVIEEKTNPDNKVYELPHTNLLGEFRPELIGTLASAHKFVLRPRASAEYILRSEDYTIHTSQDTAFKAFFNEAYYSWSFASKWQAVVGLQNYQWGPAELASPTNPVFDDLGLDKTYFFETRGKTLVRLSYAPSMQTSIVLLAEPAENGTKQPVHDEKFRRKGLIKAEYADESLTNYLGIVAAASDEDESIYGLYGSFEILTGFSTYFDVATRIGNRVFYPVQDAAGLRFEQTLVEDGDWQTTGVVGFRYVTEKGVDLRLEGFSDSQAWSKKDRDLGRLVMGAFLNEENIQLYLNPGTLLPGKKFTYVSARLPDWGYKDSITLTLRNLHSLTDNTEKNMATLDTYWNDHFVISTGIVGSYGPQNGELTQGYFWSAFLGGLYTF